MPRSLVLLYALLLLPARARSEATGSIKGVVVSVDKNGQAHPRAGVVVSVAGLGPAPATERGGPRVRQRDKAFDPQLTVVTVGTTVEFPNEDRIFHNVFSLSEPAKFDLGLYKSGVSKSVTMRRAGVVDVYCNIHPQMIAKIKVLENDYWAVTRADGSFRIDRVPPGAHPLTAWQPSGEPRDGNVVVTAGASANVRLEIPEAQPNRAHLRKDGTPYGRYK